MVRCTSSKLPFISYNGAICDVETRSMAGKPKHYTAMNDLNGDTIALELSSCALERCGCVCHYALAIMWRKFCLSASHCVLGYSQPHHLVTSATRSLRVRLEMDVLYGVRVNARTVVTYEE